MLRTRSGRDRRRVRRAAGLLLVLALLGACSEPQRPPGSSVWDDGATIDFQSMPTRTQVGMGPDGYAAYPRAGADPVPTTLVLPTGTVRRSFSAIRIGANYAFAPDGDERHQPTDFDFSLKVRSLAQARTVLTEDADALGLSDEEVDDITGEGTSVEQGYVRGWLSTEVEASASADADGSMNLFYSVTIGHYHDEAVDRVLHDGRMTVDLTARPTATDLGFREAYDSVSIIPEPHRRQLRVTLRTPRGRTTLPTSSFSSARSDGMVTSSTLLGSTDLARAPATARSAAGAFGLDVEPALLLVRTARDDLQRSEIPCASTAVYTCAVRVETTTDGSLVGYFGYRITLTYR